MADFEFLARTAGTFFVAADLFPRLNLPGGTATLIEQRLQRGRNHNLSLRGTAFAPNLANNGLLLLECRAMVRIHRILERQQPLDLVRRRIMVAAVRKNHRL